MAADTAAGYDGVGVWGQSPDRPAWPGGQAYSRSPQLRSTPQGLPATQPAAQRPGRAGQRHAGSAVCPGGAPAASPVWAGAASSGAVLGELCGPGHGSVACELGERKAGSLGPPKVRCAMLRGPLCRGHPLSYPSLLETQIYPLPEWIHEYWKPWGVPLPHETGAPLFSRATDSGVSSSQSRATTHGPYLPRVH